MPGLGDLLSDIIGKKRKKGAIGAGGIDLQSILQGLSAPQGGIESSAPAPPTAPSTGTEAQLADLLAGVQSGMGHMNVIRSGSSTGPSGLDVYRDPNNPPITVPYHGGSFNFYAPSWLRELGRSFRRQA